MVRSISQQFVPYAGFSGSTRHEGHTHEHYTSKDQGAAIGAIFGAVIGVYLAATFTVPAATGSGGPGAGVAAALATVGGSMVIGATLGGAIGTVVGEDGQEAPPAQSSPASPQEPAQGQDEGVIGIGPFNTGDPGSQGPSQGGGGADSGAGTGAGPGSSGGGACFLGGTPVVLADGRRMPIEQIPVGALVVAQDPDSGDVSAQPATHTFTHHVRSTLLLSFSDGTTLHTTRQHRFFVPERGFLAAGRLTPGMSVVTLGNQYLTVLGSTPVEREAIVYNLEVAQAHTYFVGPQGVWVHNEKIDDPPD